MEKPMPALHEMFAANVPRYTSYPTAPHFHGGIDGETCRSWLAALPPHEPLSLYAHIPFCDSLCWFCACHTTAVNNYAPVAAYCELLLQEMTQVADALPGRMPVRHIHWGGGSPTILNATDIGRLNDTLRSRFDVLPDAEFAVEIDPRGFTSALAATLARAGVTRASLGVQDCDPAVQRAINRVQSDDETFDAIATLRAEGVRSINIDLVYGLPRQTLESWARTLDFILWLKPDRIAVFGYAHVPAFKKHQALIPDSLLPDVEARFRMAEQARHVLCAHGYVAIGIDHYALPQDTLGRAAQAGSLHRNFQGYTTDGAATLIGFGASAISALPQGYVQNATAVPDYRARLFRKELATARGVELRPQDRLRRTIIERLMCGLSVDLEGLPGFDGDMAQFGDAFQALDRLAEQGVVRRQGARIVVPQEWRAATRLVSACFDQYLTGKPARHSVAI
jgi:oxygen-independent coproporphyrinogen-3 oxidase